MNKLNCNILLADDDEDDCLFFKDALDELALAVTLKTVNDGEQLMKFLVNNASSGLPDVLFLDLNMPRKSGYECLTEMKMIEQLKHLPVIVFSTSFNTDTVDLMYEKGAIHYIQKPGDFDKLKKIIKKALHTTEKSNFKQPVRTDFVLQP